jgi:subtilisin family serine protease
VYDEALVVVVADHGVSLRPGQPRRNATAANLVDLAFVPLFVKEPGRSGGRVDDSPARTVDVLPTIADALGARLPWAVDGRSLLRATPAVEGSVTIPDQDGEAITRDLRSLLAERRRALAAQARLFGTGGWDAVYAVGADPALLGASVSELAVAEASQTVELTSGVTPAMVRRDRVPAYLAGRIAGGAPDRTLAVAVNGTIVAVTRTYADGGDAVFSAMLPEETLREGADDVEVLLVREGSGSPTLARLRTAPR